MISKKLFLNLTIGSAIVLSPIALVASCSSSSSSPGEIFDGKTPAPGIDGDVFNNIIKHTFGDKEVGGGEYENLIRLELKKAVEDSNKAAKTNEEVLEIAKNNLKRITKEQLQEMLNVNLVKGISKNEYILGEDSSKNLEIKGSAMSQASISDLSINNSDNTLISFKLSVYKQLDFNAKNNNGNYSAFNIDKQIYWFKNIKIKPSVSSLDNYENKLLPVIIFDENQEGASLTFDSSSSFEIKNGIETALFLYDNNYQYIQTIIKDRDKFRKIAEDSINAQKEKINKDYDNAKKIDDLGHFDGKFSMKNWSSRLYDGIFEGINSLPDILGFDTNTQKPESIQYSPIIFSQMDKKTNKAQWQVFNSKLIVDDPVPAPGIDGDVFNNVIKHTFRDKKDGDGNYENLILQEFEKAVEDSNKAAKTNEEVLKIAENNLKNITKDQFQEMLNVNLAKGLEKFEILQNGLKSLGIFQASISDLSINNEKTAISFKLSVFVNYSFKPGPETIRKSSSVNQSEKKIYSFKNIKIKPSVSEYKNKLLPVIIFDENQEGASLTFDNSSSYELNNYVEFFLSMWDNNFGNIQTQFPNRDEFKKISEEMEKNILNQYKKSYDYAKKANNLGHENGKFTIRTFNDRYSELFRHVKYDILGLKPSYNGNNFETTSLDCSPMIFSQMDKKTNKAQWQVFNKKEYNQ